MSLKFEDIPIESGKYIVKLDKPIEAHGQSLTELRLSEPTLKDIEEAEKMGSQQSMVVAMVAKLADIPPSSVQKISVRDFKKNIEPVLVALMGESPETGKS